MIGIAGEQIKASDLVTLSIDGRYLTRAIFPRPLPKQRIFHRDGDWWLDTDPSSARYDPKDIFRPSVKVITWSYLPYIRSGPRPRKSTTL